MPYDTLDWSIHPVLQNMHGEDDHGNEIVIGQTLYAEVTPIVNGTPVSTGWTFDTVALLVRNQCDYHLFDLFTCSCGVAGCAGINDEIHLRVGPTEVQLQIPRQAPFLARFIPTHFPDAEAALVWTFEAAAYHQALADLVVRLQALDAANPGTPVTMWADDGVPDRRPTEDIATQMANAHKWFAQSRARTEGEKAYHGVLYCAGLEMNIQDATYKMQVHNLFSSVADTLFGEDPEDEDADKLRDEWLDEQVVYYRDHPQELIALFKSLPWERFEEDGYMFHANSTSLVQALADQWPNVDVALVPMENPQEQDWTLL